MAILNFSQMNEIFFSPIGMLFNLILYFSLPLNFFIMLLNIESFKIFYFLIFVKLFQMLNCNNDVNDNSTSRKCNNCNNEQMLKFFINVAFKQVLFFGYLLTHRRRQNDLIIWICFLINFL